MDVTLAQPQALATSPASPVAVVETPPPEGFVQRVMALSPQRKMMLGGGLAALLGSAAPEDVRTLVRMHLVDLDKQLSTLLAAQDVKLDDYTRAHLQDSQERIRKVLAAQVMVPSID